MTNGGGLKMPRRGQAATLLSELNAEHAASAGVPEPPEDDSASADAEMRNTADAEYRKQGSAEVREAAREEVRTAAREEGSAPASASSRAPVLPAVREHGSTGGSTGGRPRASAQVRQEVRKAASSTGDFTEQVKDAIRQKRNHGGGNKTSVDMTPELALRLKRFCLDNGNPPARLVFIELVEAFLAEEGY